MSIFLSSIAWVELTLISTLETELVEIHIGKEEKIFHVHKKKLFDKVPYLKLLLGNSHDSIIRLPDYSPSTFDVLVEWVYTGVLPNIDMIKRKTEDGDSTIHLSWAVKDLYRLATRLELLELMDRVMEVKRRMEASYDMHLTCKDLKKVYAFDPEVPKLRQYCTELAVYILRKHKGGLGGLSTAEMLPVMENQDFARDYLNISQDLKLKDPRKGSGCRFHTHGEDEECSARKYTSEGRAIYRSLEEIEKERAPLAKKQKLSPASQKS